MSEFGGGNNKFLISVPQIKAARALLGWTQRDLARMSGISLASIAQIESGAGNPRVATMTVLRKTFEKHGTEFSDEPGVRIQREPFGVEVWQGRDAIHRVWNDIESTFSDGKGGEVLLSMALHPVWEEFFPGQVVALFERRKKLNIVTRGLMSSPEDNFVWETENIRLVSPEALHSHTPYYVYADKVALLKITEPVRVVLISNATLAESFHKQFSYLWNTGKKIS